MSDDDCDDKAERAQAPKIIRCTYGNCNNSIFLRENIPMDCPRCGAGPFCLYHIYGHMNKKNKACSART